MLKVSTKCVQGGEDILRKLLWSTHHGMTGSWTAQFTILTTDCDAVGFVVCWLVNLFHNLAHSKWAAGYHRSPKHQWRILPGDRSEPQKNPGGVLAHFPVLSSKLTPRISPLSMEIWRVYFFEMHYPYYLWSSSGKSIPERVHAACWPNYGSSPQQGRWNRPAGTDSPSNITCNFLNMKDKPYHSWKAFHNLNLSN